MVRWRLQKHLSILTIFSDFLMNELTLNSDFFEETVAKIEVTLIFCEFEASKYPLNLAMSLVKE